MKIFAFFLLLTTGCSLFTKNDDSKEFGRLHLQIGTSLLSQGKYPAALKELLAAEKFDPTSPLIQNNLGIAYYVRKENSLAIKHFIRAIDLDSKYSEARVNYGIVLLETADYATAIEQFQKVVNDLVYPYPEKARVHLGTVYFHQKKYPQAQKLFIKAIDINRNYCPAWTFLGRSLLEENKFKIAAQRLDHAVSVCKSSDAYESDYYSGFAYYKLGEKERAVARLETILDSDPSGIFAEKSRQLLKTIGNKDAENEANRSVTTGK